MLPELLYTCYSFDVDDLSKLLALLSDCFEKLFGAKLLCLMLADIEEGCCSFTEAMLFDYCNSLAFCIC